MENLIIEATHLVPTIIFDNKSGDFNISGRLISISDQYFKPVIEWVKEYSTQPADKTILDIDLEYCSSGGIKFLFHIFKIFESMHLNGAHIQVVWHYFTDDEDAAEKGFQFRKLLNFPVEVLPHFSKI